MRRNEKQWRNTCLLQPFLNATLSKPSGRLWQLPGAQETQWKKLWTIVDTVGNCASPTWSSSPTGLHCSQGPVFTLHPALIRQAWCSLLFLHPPFFYLFFFRNTQWARSLRGRKRKTINQRWRWCQMLRLHFCEVHGFESKLQKSLTTATEENSMQSLKIHVISTSREMGEHCCLQMPLLTYPQREISPPSLKELWQTPQPERTFGEKNENAEKIRQLRPLKLWGYSEWKMGFKDCFCVF